MAEFKTRAASAPLKTKTFQVKSGQALRDLKTGSASAHFRGRDAGIGSRVNTRSDQFAFQMRMIGRQGGKLAKSVPLAAGRSIAAKTDGEINEKYGSAADDAENYLKLTGVQARKYTYRVAHLPPGLARKRLEEKLLGEEISAPVTAKTAYSPYKLRRQMFDKAYKKRRFDQRRVRAKRSYSKAKTAAQAAKRQASLARQAEKKAAGTVRFTGRAVGKVAVAAGHLFNAIKEGVKIGVSAVASILPWIAAAGLPLLIVIAIVIAAGPASDAAQNGSGMLEVVSGSGTISKQHVTITITNEEGEEILSFTAVNSEGRFIYTKPAEGEKEATNLSGRIKGKKITLKGMLQGIPISMEGTVKKGAVKMEGFWGELAEEAMSGDWQNPFGKTKYIITSEFGVRVHPITGEIRQHDGYDMCATTGAGAKIYAASSGTVSLASGYGGYGNCVIIDHGGGIQSLYGHMSSISVKSGQKVRVGTKIGTEGSTGDSTGAHLHFEVRKNGTAVDGKVFLKTLYTNAVSVDIWS
ncbi:M23 family metallopeptidase [Ihubacter sp. mB4P-1]|uniref:M23 family metallopeptidase n=1 Tax=Ihubacter sp. mB4P-1 TaxID=3242370 RepID=UPI003C7CA742